MFTLQSPNIVAWQQQAGMSAAMQQSMMPFGNCAQALEHRGPVQIAGNLPSPTYGTQGGNTPPGVPIAAGPATGGMLEADNGSTPLADERRNPWAGVFRGNVNIVGNLNIGLGLTAATLTINGVNAVGSPRMIWGQMAGPLTPGGNVNCSVAFTANGPAPLSSVTVYDKFGTLTGNSGTAFCAVENLLDHKFYFVATQFGRIIFGTLGGTLMAGGNVTCNVALTLWGADAGSTVTVYDDGYGTLTGTSGKVFAAVENLANGHFVFMTVGC